MKATQVATPAAPDFKALWDIHPGFSDRFGCIEGPHADDSLVQSLLADEALLKQLTDQMWDDATFLSYKDGRFGVLFEGEFTCVESDEANGEFYPGELKTYTEEVSTILGNIPALEAAFPGVCFAVPEKSQIVEDRAGLWAFVPDGHPMDRMTRRRLGMSVLSLGELEPDHMQSEEAA